MRSIPRLAMLGLFALLAFASIAPANPPVVRNRTHHGHVGQQVLRGLAYNAGAAFGLAGGCADCAPAAAFVPMQAVQDCGVPAAQFAPQYSRQFAPAYGLGLQRNVLGAYGLGAAFDPGVGYIGVNRGVILRQRGIVLRQRGVIRQRGIFRGGNRQVVRQRNVARR